MTQSSLIHQHWYLRKVHISWRIATLSLGVVLGAALARFADYQFSDISWLLLGVCMVFIGMVIRLSWILVLLLSAGILIGIWRGSGEAQQFSAYERYFDSDVLITGNVTNDPTYGPKGDLRFIISEIEINSTHMSGTVWVSVNQNFDLKRGDIVTVSGELSRGFGTIPASLFQASIDLVERPVPGDIGRQVRDWFAVGIYSSMSTDQAQLALAFLVGQKLTVSETLNDQLKTVGLVHAVVASGYHLTVIVQVIRRLLMRLSKYLTFVISMAMMIGFILITGLSPSMTRAGLVTGLALLAWYYGRIIHPVVLLPFTAALTVLYRPEYVWGDIGWYLSFTAFAGVLILAPLINDYFWDNTKHPGLMRQILVATVAAQIATFPILIYVFGYYSPYALLANLLVVPLIPLAMLLTFITGMAGLLFASLGAMVAFPVVMILSYTLKVVAWIASLPSAKVEIELSSAGLVIAYMLIVSGTTLLWKLTKHDFRQPKRPTDIL